MADVEVDWLEYFKSIKSVCPWSISAALQGKIRITEWHSQIQQLEHSEAIVYVALKLTPRRLKKLSCKYNTEYDQYEFLWSHPRYKNHSTPVPVLIQQSRSKLESIRLKQKNLALDK